MERKEDLKSKKYIGGYKPRIDYEKIYRKVLAVCPGMQGIIDHVRKVVPIRYKEYEDLCKAIVNKTDDYEYAKSRLFDTNLHFAVKNALYAYEKYGMDLEDAFQICSMGIMKAIDKYNFGVKGKFSSYTSTWMRQVLWRKHYLHNRNVFVPLYYSEYINEVIKKVEKHTDSIDFNTIDSNELYGLLLKYADCSEEEASCICRILSVSADIDAMDEEEPVNVVLEEEFFGNILNKMSCNGVMETLELLSKREKEVLLYRAQGKTLDDIAKIYCVTRERIRQIEERAKFRLMNYYFQTGKVDRLTFWNME